MAEENSDKVDKRLEQTKALMESFLSGIGLSKIKFSSKAISLLNSTEEDRIKMGKMDCEDGAIVLRQYAIHLQIEENKVRAAKGWAEDSLNVMMGKYRENYGDTYTKHEERIMLMAANDSFAKRLVEIVRETKTRLTSLSFLTRKIENLADDFKQLARSK